ncbi:MAG: signal recognition particle-docking protein FtsY [Actinomycetota bacterium]
MSLTILIVVLVLLAALGAVVAVMRRSSGPRRDDGPSGVGTATLERPPRTSPAPPRAPSKEALGARVRSLFGGRPATEEDWKALEDLLIRSDVGPVVAADLTRRVRERYTADADMEEILVSEITEELRGDPSLSTGGESSVWMVVGVNGAGKTTTIGKLAVRLAGEGKKVSLAGSDTFRAAASEQLDVWAKRGNAHLVSQERGADPGSVAFDAVESARARGSDVLIVDTAGRLHTRTPLMDELAKVRRVLERAAGGVDETLLVLDATTGQNGIAQARAFTDAVEVTGVVLAKMDGTAKGGIVLAVRGELGVPVKLVGTGEGPNDLEPFDAAAFADRLVRG